MGHKLCKSFFKTPYNLYKPIIIMHLYFAKKKRMNVPNVPFGGILGHLIA